MAFNEALHKRGTGAQGGQFVTKGAGGQTTKTSSIGYSGGAGKGTGYGAKGGDPNVKSLQTELNRLGILDAQGNQLKVDGKFGPKTTAAVRRLQARLGMSVDGRITPALLSKIKKLKPSQHDQHVMHQRHLGAQHKKHAAHSAHLAHKQTAAKQHQAHAAHAAHQSHAAHQKNVAAKKAAPAKRVPAKPAARKATVTRSVGYSGAMTDLTRHLPGAHNQASHGNRVGNIKAPSSGIGKGFHKRRKGTGEIHVFDRVKISGDVSPSLARTHKGHTARVESFLGEGSRVRIRFEHDDSTLDVHPRDLQVIDTAEELNNADLKALDEGHDFAHQLKLKGPRKRKG